MFFYRLGSDAEFVFARISEFRPLLVNAQAVVGANKSLTLASFIGTDGHASTAELRPRPAHNVRMHMLDIAAGLLMTADVLKVKKNFQDVFLLARPIINDETMAGHVHISFFTDEPSTKKAMECGFIYNGQTERLESVNHNPGSPLPSLTSDDKHLAPILADYAEKAYNGKLLTPHRVASRLAWFLHPLELWLQPWHDRVARNHSYGLGSDIVRWNSPTAQRPVWDNMSHLAFIHYEYRTPSTWLVHPALAYVYLALAKITMTNWKLIDRLYTFSNEEKVLGIAFSKNPANSAAGDVFFERLRKAEENGLRLSRDVEWLGKALDICVAKREEWFASPTARIDIEAWRELL